jgi:hypothetical protein
VVGIFPNEASITRLVGPLLLEQNDDWQLRRRYMSLEALRTQSDNQTARLSAVVSCARVQPDQDSRLVHHSAGRDLSGADHPALGRPTRTVRRGSQIQ